MPDWHKEALFPVLGASASLTARFNGLVICRAHIPPIRVRNRARSSSVSFYFPASAILFSLSFSWPLRASFDADHLPHAHRQPKAAR